MTFSEVHRWYCINTTKRIMEIISLPDLLVSLISPLGVTPAEYWKVVRSTKLR